jgi:hypothetical protein
MHGSVFKQIWGRVSAAFVRKAQSQDSRVSLSSISSLRSSSRRMHLSNSPFYWPAPHYPCSSLGYMYASLCPRCFSAVRFCHKCHVVDHDAFLLLV